MRTATRVIAEITVFVMPIVLAETPRAHTVQNRKPSTVVMWLVARRAMLLATNPRPAM